MALTKRTRRATDPPSPRFRRAPPAQADPKLAPFLRDDFDGTAYASGVLAGGPDAPKDAKKVLDRTIADLDAALALEVREHHDELLHQLGGIDEADRVLQIVKGGVTSLRQTMGRVRDEIVEPHTAVDAKTRQLDHLTRTVDLLRRVVRASKLNAKLRAALRVEDDVDEEKDVSAPNKKAEGSVESSARLEAERRRRAAAAAAGDLAKAAKTLGEIEELRREGAGEGLGLGSGDDFAGVDVVERDARWLAEAGRETRRRAGAALDAGIASASQAEVGAALQVFHNLGELKPAVDARVASLAASAVDAVREALDPKALAREAGGSDAASGSRLAGGSARGRAFAPPPGEEERWAEILWQRLERALDAARADCLAVWHLQRVLAKKRDPITHALFLDEALGPFFDVDETREAETETFSRDADLSCARENEDDVWVAERRRGGSSSARAARAPCRRFVGQFSKGAGEALARAHASAGFAKDALLAGYPRLVALLETLHARLARDSDAKGAPSAVAGDGGDARRLAKIAEPVAQAYLGRAFQRLSEPVDALLSPSALQTLAQSVSMGGVASSSGSAGAGRGAADVRRFLARVREELDAVAARPSLSAAVAESGVAKALRLMARRAETAVATGAEARAFALGQPATGAHRANAMLAASLEQVCAAMAKVLRDPALEESSRGGVGGSGVNARAARKMKASLRAATTALAETARDVAALALDAAFERVSAHFAAMHDEDWAGGPPPGEHCSPYAARVAETLAWLREAHVKPLFPPLDAAETSRFFIAANGDDGNSGGASASSSSDSVSFLMASPTGEARRAFANRVFASFVRHACLLRPMGENGRLRLAKDTAELERAVDECAFPAKLVGAIPKIAAATSGAATPSTTAFAERSEGGVSEKTSKPPSAHDAVRALRGAVFLGLDELVADLDASRTPEPSSALGHLPAACVLMLAFSAAPASLQTPYQRAGLTPALYAAWMEKHAAEEVAAAADATLDAFEAKRGEKDAEAAAAAEKVRRAKRLLFP